ETRQAVTGAMHSDEKRKLIVVADTHNGVYCVSDKGTLRWSRVGQGRNLAGVGTNAFGDVVVTNTEGQTMVYHIESGKTLDSFTLPEFHASVPTIGGTCFYGATLGRVVYCYDYVKHQMNWTFEANGRMYSAPALDQSSVIVGDNNGRVYFLDRATGQNQVLGIFPERVTNPILLTPQNILISTFANELYMMRNAAGAVPPAAHEPNHPATDHDSIHRA
ncbi:PQQ-binding-like beta-propeller repeat protein, partial [Candidatus Saccharibacteria bacterium]|nr:PQQ-binding-like beta-propeller repeat protein [Candidatus Saccharibacteria bacterium]